MEHLNTPRYKCLRRSGMYLIYVKTNEESVEIKVPLKTVAKGLKRYKTVKASGAQAAGKIWHRKNRKRSAQKPPTSPPPPSPPPPPPSPPQPAQQSDEAVEVVSESVEDLKKKAKEAEDNKTFFQIKLDVVASRLEAIERKQLWHPKRYLFYWDCIEALKKKTVDVYDKELTEAREKLQNLGATMIEATEVVG